MLENAGSFTVAGNIFSSKAGDIYLVLFASWFNFFDVLAILS
jgi:hypothetical protein